jgi:hypothetical protein
MSYTRVTVDVGIGDWLDKFAPLPLQQFVPPSQWSSFRDKVNDSMEKRRRCLRLSKCLPCGMVLAIAGWVALLYIREALDFDPSHPINGIIALLGIVAIVVSPIASIYTMRRAWRKFHANIYHIVQEANAEFQNVTIHYRGRYPELYLEFLCGQVPELPDDNTRGAEAGIPFGVAVPTGDDKNQHQPPHDCLSTKERLCELEKLKDYMTAEEYREKRHDILSSI